MSRRATPATQNDIEPVWTPSKMTGFAASLIDTATLQENQRIETRHVGTSKRAFRARLPELFTLCSYKVDAFLWVFSWTPKSTTSKSMFGARLLQTPRVKREPLLRIREKKQMNIIKTWVFFEKTILWSIQHPSPISSTRSSWSSKISPWKTAELILGTVHPSHMADTHSQY